MPRWYVLRLWRVGERIAAEVRRREMALLMIVAAAVLVVLAIAAYRSEIRRAERRGENRMSERWYQATHGRKAK